ARRDHAHLLAVDTDGETAAIRLAHELDLDFVEALQTAHRGFDCVILLVAHDRVGGDARAGPLAVAVDAPIAALRHAQLVGAEIEKRLSRRQHAAAAIAEPALQPFADIAGPVVARGVAVADLEDRDPTAAATALVGLEHRVEIGERAAGAGV